MIVERDLLLHLLGRPTAAGELTTLAAGVDWSLLLSLATPFVQPYLALQLERTGASASVPPAVRERFDLVRRSTAISHLHRVRALRLALGALESRRIPAVVLKGMALAYLVYPNPVLRPMQDIDLWVPQELLDEVAVALIAVGFRFPARMLDGLGAPGQPDEGLQRSLELPGTTALVELHGSVPSLREDEGVAWARALPTSLAGTPARVLYHEDLLRHVAMHFARQHGFDTGLAGLLDIRLIVERWQGQWNWAAMAQRYRETGVATWMRIALTLARRLLAAPVPDALLEALPPPPNIEEMERLATDLVWGARSALPPVLERLVSPVTIPHHAGWLERRLGSYVRRGPVEFGRRVLFDLTVRLPRYARLWARGELRGSRLRERVRLSRERSRLEALIRGAGRPPATSEAS